MQPIGEYFPESKMLADLNIKKLNTYYSLCLLKDKGKVTVKTRSNRCDLIMRIDNIDLAVVERTQKKINNIKPDLSSDIYKFSYGASSRMFKNGLIYSTICGVK